MCQPQVNRRVLDNSRDTEYNPRKAYENDRN